MSSTDTLLRAVRETEPIIRQHAAAAERDRRLAAPVAKAMKEAGLYRFVAAEGFGGFEVEPVVAFRVLEEVACIDSAAGWNLQLSTAFDMFGPWYDDDAAKEIFGPDAVLTARSIRCEKPFPSMVAIDSQDVPPS